MTLGPLSNFLQTNHQEKWLQQRYFCELRVSEACIVYLATLLLGENAFALRKFRRKPLWTYLIPSKATGQQVLNKRVKAGENLWKLFVNDKIKRKMFIGLWEKCKYLVCYQQLPYIHIDKSPPSMSFVSSLTHFISVFSSGVVTGYHHIPEAVI